MKRLLIATVAATALSTTVAFAATSIGDVAGHGDQFATMADISAVFTGFDSIEFNNIDLNGDGRIDNNELLNSENREILARYEVNTQAGTSKVAADANGDGFVSFAELTSVIPGFIKHDFDDIDVNSDNRLSANEIYTGAAVTIFARSSATKTSMHLTSLDTNGDRFLSFAELHAAYPNLPRLEFGNIDTNNDGRLNSSELEALDAVMTLGSY